MTFFCRLSEVTIEGGVMKATAKLIFLVGAIALTTTVSAWAQTQERILITPLPAVKPKPVKPGEPPPLFTVNENTLSYIYYARATDPGAGQSPKNTVLFNHFDVWAYGTNFLSVQW